MHRSEQSLQDNAEALWGGRPALASAQAMMSTVGVLESVSLG